MVMVVVLTVKSIYYRSKKSYISWCSGCEVQVLEGVEEELATAYQVEKESRQDLVRSSMARGRRWRSGRAGSCGASGWREGGRGRSRGFAGLIDRQANSLDGGGRDEVKGSFGLKLWI